MQIFFADAVIIMISLYYKNHKEKLRKIRKLQTGSWVYVVEPTDEEIAVMKDRWELEEGHIRDALDPNEVPRYETEGSDAYIFVRIPVENVHSFNSIPLLFILRKKMIVTVMMKEHDAITAYLTNSRLRSTQRNDVFLALSEAIISYYSSYLIRINKLVYSKSVQVDTVENRDVIALVSYEHIINEWLNAVVQMNVFLNTLSRKKSIFPNVKDRERVEDLFLATGQLIALFKSSLLNVKNMRDAYSTIMTNNLNRIIKFFTTLTIVMTIPTIVASFYGMNVNLPFDEHPQSFFFILVSTIVLCITLLYIFSKKRWL